MVALTLYKFIVTYAITTKKIFVFIQEVFELDITVGESF